MRVLAIFALLGAATAVADETCDTAARCSLDEGDRLLRAKRPKEAALKYLESYNADRAPGTLLSYAEALEADGQLAAAFDAWSRALEAGKQLERDASRREHGRTMIETANGGIARLSGRVMRVTFKDGGAAVLVARRGAAELLPVQGAEIRLDAITDAIEIRYPSGRTRFERLDVVGGRAITFTVPPDEQKVSPPIGRGHARSWVALGVGVVGTATLAASGVFAWQSRKDRAAANCDERNICASVEDRELLQRANDRRLLSIGGAIAGGALVSVALVLWLTDHAHTPVHTSRIDVAPNRDGGFVTWVVGF